MEDEEMRGHDIPIELLIEIFVYLPIVSLIRFTCVCKTWLTLIRNDRRFAMRHFLLNRASCLSMDKIDFIVDYSRYLRASPPSTPNDEVQKVCVYELTEKKTFRLVKKLDIGSGLGVMPSNFCHGIMCIQVYPSFCSSRRHLDIMFLCNLAIGEVVRVPCLVNANRFGIGFDSARDDYKIVSIAYHGTYWQLPWRVDVYSVRNGCWHTLNSDDVALLDEFESFDYVVVLNANDRILNFMGQQRSRKKSVVSFDMVDEVFSKTPMPECGCGEVHSHKLLPSSRWCACVCCFNSSGLLKENESIDIWVIDDFESCRTSIDDNSNDVVQVGFN